jgi:transposase
MWISDFNGTMAGKSKRPGLLITTPELENLQGIAQSRTQPMRKVVRARILFRYQAGERISQIAQAVGTCRDTVYECIDRALAMGIEAALEDLPHSPKQPVITPEAKAWVIHLACSKPTEFGYAAELWTRQSLAQHVRSRAVATGHPSLAKAVKATIQRILNEESLKPHKIRYYLERRDPEFEIKMREVLLVYKELELYHQTGSLPKDSQQREVMTISVDEKPGVQAIANTAADLPPIPGKHAALGRDYEYKRMGTCSILAGLDLQDGHVNAVVERKHRSREFVALLKAIDADYPSGVTIRLLLDNHSSHLSKETRAYLATRPNRFVYVHTPKHGSWLNLVETLFGKMSRTFLRGIRVHSWEELRQRILQGIAEINAAPVVHRWKKFDLLHSA